MKTITLKNLPDNYHDWLKEKAKESGVSMSAIIKMLIRDAMANRVEK